MHGRAPRIAVAAILIAIGNISSRLLGLGRVSVIAYFFGRDPDVDAYTAALTIPITVYDLLINGAMSAALVPVLSEYAEGDSREFWRIVSSIFNLAFLVLVLLVGVMIWQAPLIVNLLVQASRPELYPLTVLLVRAMLPAVLLMGLAGLITAVLYAKQTFLLPAFTVATFNAGIILGAMLFQASLGLASLAVGMGLGALGQVLLQSPGLRGLRYYPTLDPSHPAIRRILRLYAPVALGIGISVIGVAIDRWLASGYETALGTMMYATTLIQFPLGLVASAVSLAILPSLSRLDAAADHEAFRQMLAMGVKVVLWLVLPAAVGMMVLRNPITALLLERGAFVGSDTQATALALLCYLPGLPAAAIDQVLIFSFYARKDTLTPNLVQGGAVLIYLLTAIPLLFFTNLGFLALVIGNSAQWIGHALLMVVLLGRRVPLTGLRLGEAMWKGTLASILMGGGVFWFSHWLTPFLEHSPWPLLVHLGLAIPLGVIVYGGGCLLLRVEAMSFFAKMLARGERRNSPPAR